MNTSASSRSVQVWLWLASVAFTGCSSTPGWWTSSAPPPPVPAPVPSHFAAEHGPITPVGFNAPGAVHDQLSLLSQELAEAADDKKMFLARLQMLEKELAIRDQALAEAAREVKTTRDEVGRTRTEIQRWKAEIEGVRGRLEGIDAENVQNLKALIQTLEQMLQRAHPGAAPADGPALSPLPVLPPPRPLTP